MSIVTVDDLHLTADPARVLDGHAHVAAAGHGQHRLIVRCPNTSPNSITALRADDIAELLHAHGRLLELGITDDGTILAAADIVPRRGKVAIWTGYAIGPWHPSDITERGLGGSETAAVRLAEELAAMNYQVTLYGQFQQTGMVGDVMLRDFQLMDWTEPTEATIVFRNAGPFDERPNTRFAVLWLEDLPGGEGLTPQRAANIDRICAVTHWHKRDTEAHYPWLAGMKTADGRNLVAACRNGIHLPWYQVDDGLVREPRVIYSSSPDRGGDIVLELWPRVRERVPDAQLILTYSRWYDICYEAFGATDAHRRMIELLKQPGVRRVEGGLGQRDLAQLMRSSLVWCHPSWWSAGDREFHETSCISAMEAQAAGCVVVASNWGALTETVQHGTMIDGDPRERDGAWENQFVDAIVAGLTDPVVQQTAQTVGPEMMADMGWDGAAEQLASYFTAATLA